MAETQIFYIAGILAGIVIGFVLGVKYATLEKR